MSLLTARDEAPRGFRQMRARKAIQLFRRLYPITDPYISGLSHLDQVARLIKGGATLIQLRDKHASPREFYRATCECVALAHHYGARIVVNDRVDIAIAAGADGVHLGQDDLDPVAARGLLGPERIVGYSTHNLDQAARADGLPIDYIAIGPVFGTSTKVDPDPVVGLESVKAVRARVSKPLVAIGGITLGHAREVIAAGADSVAVIADLYSKGDIEGRTHQYLTELDDGEVVG